MAYLIGMDCIAAVDSVDVPCHCKHPWMNPFCVRSVGHIDLKGGQIHRNHLIFSMTWHIGFVFRHSHSVEMIITEGG